MQGEEAPPGASVTRALSSPRRHPLLVAGPPAALTRKEAPTPLFLPSPSSRASNVLNAGFHGLMENFPLMQSIT